MHLNDVSSDRIRLWTPDTLATEFPLGSAIAECLAAAFGSGVWSRTPMPVGDCSVPHSARGIVAELGASARVLVASTEDGKPHDEADVLGCVVGGLLDDELIHAYGLGSFGARRGDALLAYIGVHPAAQGSRVLPRTSNCFDLAPASDRPCKQRPGVGLASLLFSRWLKLSAIERCPRVFVRTRSVLPQIQHLATKNGFVYQGQFELEFQGERQDRMVYSRINSQAIPWQLPLVA